MRSLVRIGTAMLAAGALALGLAACSPSEPAPTTPSPSSSPAPITVLTNAPSPSPTPVKATLAHSVAVATTDSVVALDEPNGAVVEEFANPIASGAPLTFYIEENDGEWLHVRLPMRPNGTTGWIKASDVEVQSLQYSLHVSTADHTVTLLKDDEVVETYPAAVGTGDTPTPLGDFYITELLAPTNPGYGPFAFGLSAYSEVLNEFGGGPGQIGLHGTDDAGSIGNSASHGCIRLHNEDITTLANLLPLGTPITIE